MKDDFYSKKSALGVPNALVLLMLVFFFVPFAGRGARMALQKTENNVKDWLPSDFRETEELDWFAKRFVSEQFIIATWDGCVETDDRLKLFVSKLHQEQMPEPGEDGTKDAYYQARALGSELALFVDQELYLDWGGKNEKWLVDEHGQAYFITPNGRLHRWEGGSNVVGAAWRALARATGSFRLEGQFVAAFGDPGTDEDPNPFWEDPRLLTTPLFKTVETGPDLVDTLAGQGGSLYNPSEPRAGEREAISRLTGTMFGPAVPSGFGWTTEDFQAYLGEERAAGLPEGWESVWDFVIQNYVDENYDGDLNRFVNADPVSQSKAWYRFFDRLNLSEPERQTCVFLTLTEPARRNLSRVIGRGMMGKSPGRLFEISTECGVNPPPKPSTTPPPFSWLAAKNVPPEPAIHIGGPPVDNVAIDEEGTITLVRLIGYSAAIGLGLSLVLLRSFRLMLMVFFVGGVSALASLSMVWWCNASIDAVLLTMPSLVYVLGLAGAIHIVNYYRDATLEAGQSGAPERAISHAVVPCTLAALTTAIGLVSLCTSNILPIRKFGIFSAMGVMATLVLLYIYLPSALTTFPPREKSIRDSGQKAAQGILRFWEAIGRFILRRHWIVNTACLAAFVIMGFGLFKIKTSVQLLKLFDSQSQIISDYAWLEDNFGRLVPMELVVRFPKELQKPLEADEDTTQEDMLNARRQLSLIERIEAVTHIQNVLQDEFGYEGQDIVGRGMSAATLFRDIPPAWEGYNPARSGMNRKLAKELPALEATDYFEVEEKGDGKGTELWRLSLRLGALNGVDYGIFVSSLRSAVEPVVAAYRCRHEILTNIIDQVDQSQDLNEVRVLLLGYNDPSPNNQSKQTEDSSGAEAGSPSGIDGLALYSKALDQSLVNETIFQTSWHDPVAFPLDDGKATSEKWAQYLGRFTTVVLVNNHPDYDLAFLKEANPNFIDATDLLTSFENITPETDLPSDHPVEVSAHPGQMDVVYTGVVPVVYKAQRTLLTSLIESVAWAFVLIAIVMTCLLSPARTIWSAARPKNFVQAVGAGAVSMIPNVFPVVIIFGIMGHQQWEVDIGSMMTASVAMGVAVDDTIHFLTWFRSGMRQGMDRKDAIFVAYKHVAPAMTQTTIIGGLGLSVFAMSTFTPTQKFGTLMLALLAAALIGDLIFLPALLASPLGRIFNVQRDDSGNRKGGIDTEEISGMTEEPAPMTSEEGEYRLADEEPPPKMVVREPQMLKQQRSQVRRRT